MIRLSIFIIFLSLSLIAGDPITVEAPTSLAGKIALQTLLKQRDDIDEQIRAVVSEECKSKLSVPEAKLAECKVYLDKVVWEKQPESKKGEQK